MRNLIMSVLVLAVAMPGWAQEPEIEVEEPEIRRYTVEVIVFRYAQDVSVGSEMFRPDEPPPPGFDEPMAIIEAVRERVPEALGWPADPAARARARSVSAEMRW